MFFNFSFCCSICLCSFLWSDMPYDIGFSLRGLAHRSVIKNTYDAESGFNISNLVNITIHGHCGKMLFYGIISIFSVSS